MIVCPPSAEVRSDRGPAPPSGFCTHDRGRRHPVQAVREESLRGGVASRRCGEGPETHRVRQLLGRGRHRGAATVSVPPGVPAGAGPAVAAPAHREDRARPRAGRVDRRPLSRPHGARGRGRRLRRGTPARRGRPDHLDQPAEGHLGAARAAATAHRSLRATAHPRRPVGHPDRPGRQRHSRGAVAHHPGPPLRAHRRRADHRTNLLVVRIVSQPNRTGHSGARR